MLIWYLLQIFVCPKSINLYPFNYSFISYLYPRLDVHLLSLYGRRQREVQWLIKVCAEYTVAIWLGGGVIFSLFFIQFSQCQVVYRILALYLAWKCPKSLCGWVVGGGWVVESKLSDRLWLSFSLALAKPNNTVTHFTQ